MGKQLVCLDRDGGTRAVGTAHVVRDVFCEADCFDGAAGEVACADEAAAKVEQDFGGPGALGTGGNRLV